MIARGLERDGDLAVREYLAVGRRVYCTNDDTPDGLLIKRHPDGRRELVRHRRGGDDLRSLTNGSDTSRQAGQLVFYILASTAEIECELIRERTNAGLAARHGKNSGGGGRKPVLTPRRTEQTRKLLDAGERPRDVAKLF